MSDEFRLGGLDGANPLGFLTALGVAHLASHFAPDLLMRWVADGQGWRPVISGHGCDRQRFVSELAQALDLVRDDAFDLSPSLPYARDTLRAAMLAAAALEPRERWQGDLLAGQGTDAFADEKGQFEDTALRLVRSGDAAGNGLPAYVRRCREGLTSAQIEAALFETWRYEDDCLSFRWDPQEDQSHALRWDDPAEKANKRAGSRGVRAANALAASALALLPVQPVGRVARTTGFLYSGKRWAFTWPLWTVDCSTDLLRSILAMPALAQPQPDGAELEARGIATTMRSVCVAQSMYYRNFAPARPV